MRHFARLLSVLLVLAATLALSPSARADSATPPAGPPWRRDFAEAQREALKAGKPIFVYLTKTY